MSYQQIIYNKFRQYGMTEAGALGMLGNFQEESGCEPNRLENSLTFPKHQLLSFHIV